MRWLASSNFSGCTIASCRNRRDSALRRDWHRGLAEAVFSPRDHCADSIWVHCQGSWRRTCHTPRAVAHDHGVTARVIGMRKLHAVSSVRLPDEFQSVSAPLKAQMGACGRDGKAGALPFVYHKARGLRRDGRRRFGSSCAGSGPNAKEEEQRESARADAE